MNNITIFGNLTKDPETKESNGTKITRFTMADNYGSGDKKGVNYWNVTCFGKAGETVAKYVKKGNPLIVSGTLKTNQYTDKDGNKREYNELICNDFAFVPFEKKSETASVPAGENPFA